MTSHAPGTPTLQARLGTFLSGCRRLTASRWFPMAMILVLTLRVIGDMWLWRDLTFGDTTSYFLDARSYLATGKLTGFLFSPLYTISYAWFLHHFPDAYVATILHRIIILVGLAGALWLLFRTVLPKPVAWLVTAWWVILPINWNALYEVHLFGALVLVIGCWLAGMRRGWGVVPVSLGLGAFWACALLVRNEFLLSVGLLAGCFVIRQWWLWKRGLLPLRQIALRLGILVTPSVLITALVALTLHKSWQGWATVKEGFKARHNLNFAQVYPFSYQQRAGDWPGDPWKEGHQLVQRDFGRTDIGFSEAFRENPQAIWQHIAWHVKLLPAGIQLGLFNCHSGAISPDFTPPRQNRLRAGTLSALALLVIAAGGVCLWQRRSLYLRFMARGSAWCWISLLCTLPTCFVAIVTQRPRPSYIYLQAIFLMALCGLCLVAILRQARLWKSFARCFPVLTILVVVLARPDRSSRLTAQLYAGQPLLERYRQLYPFRSEIGRTGSVFASRQFTGELANYLSEKGEPHPSVALGDPATPAAFADTLDAGKVSVLLLEDADLSRPAILEWTKGAGSLGWETLANQQSRDGHWMLLARNPQVPSPLPPARN